jgi:hypothetical protein
VQSIDTDNCCDRGCSVRVYLWMTYFTIIDISSVSGFTDRLFQNQWKSCSADLRLCVGLFVCYFIIMAAIRGDTD